MADRGIDGIQVGQRRRQRKKRVSIHPWEGEEVRLEQLDSGCLHTLFILAGG